MAKDTRERIFESALPWPPCGSTARCSFHCPRGRRHGHGRSGGRLRDAGGGLPSLLLLARLTDWGPVAMYGALKLTDFAKITVVHLWLKKEKWVKKLTVQAA